jgi:HEPN domain-containing protein
MKVSTRDWLNAASTDLQAIERLIGEPSLTGVVAFHAQQCLEKVFKAVLEEFGETSLKSIIW